MTTLRLLKKRLLSVEILITVLFLSLVYDLPAHGDHDVWEELGQDAIVQRVQERGVTGVLHHKPYPSERRQLMVLEFRDLLGKRIQDFDATANLIDSEDELTSQAVFINWDDHGDGFGDFRPLMAGDRTYILEVEYSKGIVNQSLRFKNLRALPSTTPKEDIDIPGKSTVANAEQTLSSDSKEDPESRSGFLIMALVAMSVGAAGFFLLSRKK